MPMHRPGRPAPNTTAAYKRGRQDARACLASGGSRQDLIVMAEGADCASVTGSCSSGHRWDEHRMPGVDVKRIAIQAAQGRS